MITKSLIFIFAKFYFNAIPSLYKFSQGEWRSSLPVFFMPKMLGIALNSIHP
jgi:hypothetical protein